MKPKIFFLLLLTFIIYNLTFNIAEGTVRYVSKTGSSTPPYTSWETAADSIQKAVNIAEVGDTIYVANGVYYEAVYVDKTINLWGSSMDSTVINGVGTPNNYMIYFVNNGSTFRNFKLTSPGQPKTGIANLTSNLKADNCLITNVYVPINSGNSSICIDNFIINLFTTYAIREECPANNCLSIYTNNIILSTGSNETPVLFGFAGQQIFVNNIVIEEESCLTGVDIQYNFGAIVKNNLVAGYYYENIRAGQIVSDTIYFENNLSINSPLAYSTSTGDRTIIRNNIAKDSYKGIESLNGLVSPDYNLFWNVEQLSSGSVILGDSNIVADPMFVNDTITRLNGSYDYHLQQYSPAIDKGNPDILDVDGSRSDIGMFGGPLGQKYTYMDLAPKPPRNLTVSLDSGLVHLKWNKNTEADLFRYRVYRDTVPDFIYDTTKIIAVLADTFYYDDVPDKFNSGNYYYKITAIDTVVNQSAASEEVHITVTGIPEAPPIVVEHYNLLQNYPNPFNPSTTIPYRLKEPGYVKVMVYDIKGELVRVLVNQYQRAGYYEVEFNPSKSERKKAEGYIEFETGYYGNVASGIYLYRIEVIGEGKISVYSDMKKMVLLK
jgi:hypothetical protein